MAKHPQAPRFGLPRKTLWTAVWILLLGTGTWVVHWKSRPDSSDKPNPSQGGAPSWTGPMAQTPAPEPEEALFEESDTLPPGTPTKAKQPIEDPTAAMCGFYRALRKLEREKPPGEKVRVAHFGDSILTTDQLSGTVRRKLQARFGDGGHGFVLLGRPWNWYHHLDVVHGANKKWAVRPLTSAPTHDGLMGLGAVAFESDERNATAWAGTVDEGTFGRTVSTFDVSYLTQPRGGTLEIYIDEALKERIATNTADKQVMHRVFSVPEGPAKLTVKTGGDGPVRVFGAVLENDRPGVVYDSLAVNGARISNFERFDAHHFQSELQHRGINLVIMMIGANEGNNDALALSAYKNQLKAVLSRIRAALPDASCMVMGPLDQATYGEGGVLESKKMPKKLTRAQREIAVHTGCAFFDTFSAMGGTGSMPKWARWGLVGGDFIHPSETGARRIGKWLGDAILAGYDNFVLNGESCESNATSL